MCIMGITVILNFNIILFFYLECGVWKEWQVCQLQIWHKFTIFLLLFPLTPRDQKDHKSTNLAKTPPFLLVLESSAKFYQWSCDFFLNTRSDRKCTIFQSGPFQLWEPLCIQISCLMLTRICLRISTTWFLIHWSQSFQTGLR